MLYLFILVIVTFLCQFTSCLRKKANLDVQVFEKFDNISPDLSDRPTLTLIFTYWCPMAQSFMSEWDKLVKNYSGTNLFLNSIDADEHPDTVTALKVREFPTLILSKNGVSTEYTGQRNASAISRFIELS